MMITLSHFDLIISASLVFLLALVSLFLQLGLASRLVIGAFRTTLQLGLLGLAVTFIFSQKGFLGVALISMVMLLAAGREVHARQKRPFAGLLGYGLGTGAMMVSSFLVALFALGFVIEAEPWYQPQYAIPLLGILLGNTMNGISLGLDRLTSLAWEKRFEIEGRLLLGQDSKEAILPIKQEAFRIGLTPIVNVMAAAGLVSLPGLMTGQILAGGEPFEAAKYQIMVIFLIVAGTGFGILFALQLASKRLFDERMRLCLHRLKS